MGQYPTGPALTDSPRVTSMADPGPLAIFCFWGIVLMVCTSFLIYKPDTHVKRLFRGLSQARQSFRNSSATQQQPRRMQPRGGVA